MTSRQEVTDYHPHEKKRRKNYYSYSSTKGGLYIGRDNRNCYYQIIYVYTLMQVFIYMKKREKNILFLFFYQRRAIYWPRQQTSDTLIIRLSMFIHSFKCSSTWRKEKTKLLSLFFRTYYRSFLIYIKKFILIIFYCKMT